LPDIFEQATFNPPIQTDSNGDPYLFNEGDMGGGWYWAYTGHRNAVHGGKIYGRKAGTQAKFTSGTSADGSPTLARNHPPIEPEDIPLSHAWPSHVGPDPR